MKISKMSVCLITPLIFVLTLLFPVGLTAQFGIKAGISQSRLQYFNPNDETKSLSYNILGYNVGLIYYKKLNRSFSFQPELDFSRAGGQGVMSSGSTFKELFHSVNLNPIFRYELINQNSKTSFHFALGLVAGIVVDAKNITFSEEKGLRKFDRDIGPCKCNEPYGESYVKRVNFKRLLGAGVKFDQFIISIRYISGLSNLNVNTGGELKRSNEVSLVGTYILKTKF